VVWFTASLFMMTAILWNKWDPTALPRVLGWALCGALVGMILAMWVIYDKHPFPFLVQ